MVTTKQCSFKNALGIQCKINTSSSALCHKHDPEKKSERIRQGKKSRRKGPAFEREVANKFKNLFPKSKRCGLIQSQYGAHNAPDVGGCSPLWIETKSGKQTNPRAALKQAEDAMANYEGDSDYTIPLAVCKDDRKAPFVIINLDDFLDLLRGSRNN